MYGNLIPIFNVSFSRKTQTINIKTTIMTIFTVTVTQGQYVERTETTLIFSSLKKVQEWKDSYKTSVDSFYYNGEERAQIKEIEDDFVRVMNWVRKIWGSRCFRIPTDKTRGVVNMAVFESVCKFISLCTDDFLTVNRDDICSRYEVLITTNAYREAVTRTTASKSSVANRFRLAHDILSSSEYNNPNALW